ncbi:MAG: acyl-CoA thioesterase [Thermoplasmatota archaeon]
MHPESRPMSESRVRVIRAMQPTDANTLGNVHGGAIMRYVDETAGIVAQRHSRRMAVTARMDRMDFYEPVFIGNALILNAALAYTGHTSMEIKVVIEAENLTTGEITHTGTAWLTMIAINERGKPMPVPKVTAQGADEQTLLAEGQARYEARKKEGKTHGAKS